MSITLSQAITQTRHYLKDTTENVWTNVEIIAFIDEAIGIIKKTVPLWFTTLTRITNPTVTTAANLAQLIVIDVDYANLISIFASARCFEQDEQFYRGVQKMNEFEARKLEMEDDIYASDEYAALLAASTTVTDEHVEDVYSDTVAEDDSIIGYM